MPRLPRMNVKFSLRRPCYFPCNCARHDTSRRSFSRVDEPQSENIATEIRGIETATIGVARSPLLNACIFLRNSVLRCVGRAAAEAGDTYQLTRSLDGTAGALTPASVSGDLLQRLGVSLGMGPAFVHRQR